MLLHLNELFHGRNYLGKYVDNIFYCIQILQGKGYGSQILDFAESLASIAQLEVVSCRSDLFPYYMKRGYKEVRRFPAEKYRSTSGSKIATCTRKVV